jgi:uncharacterized protein YfcZ (UPF0381/DUF406 family)
MRNPFKSGPHLEHPVGDHDETKDINKAVEAGQAPVVDVKHPIDNSDGSSSVESFTANAQDGVKKMEATTTVWDKKSLVAAYIMMWIITFVDGIRSLLLLVESTTDMAKQCNKDLLIRSLLL